MRREARLGALVALAALGPSCLCVAEFPDYLLTDDQGGGDRPGGGDAPGFEGGASEARLFDLPRRERVDGRRDAPRDKGPLVPDGPRTDARGDLIVAPKKYVTCSDSSGVICSTGQHCIVTANAGCTGIIDCGAATVCEVNCAGLGACKGGVNCHFAKQCLVSCSNYACNTTLMASIDCSPNNYCQVACTDHSCDMTINCGNSCGCKVTCDATSCAGSTLCLSTLGCTHPAKGCNPCVTPPCPVP